MTTPRLVLSSPRCSLYQGDAVALRSVVAPESVDALVTDPPAGINFMSREWDGDKGGREQWIAWLAHTIGPAFEALKPGGHALVWAIPRTSHWTATALEEAGFEIRDVVMHLFGTGFPKSLDVSKAIDERLGAEREVVSERRTGWTGTLGGAGALHGVTEDVRTITAPATPEAARWSGWGTALKPAAEHWILARRPLAGTVAANVLAFGTGGINVDGCRIGTSDVLEPTSCHYHERGETCRGHGNDVLRPTMHGAPKSAPSGRWPAHVTLDEEAARLLDEMSGIMRARPGENAIKGCGLGYMGGDAPGTAGGRYFEHGGASRFFYVAKAPRAEKDAGLDHLPARTGGEATDRVDGSAGLSNPRAGAGRTGGARNFHPTVKSIELMRWLVRLITPPGGLVLDAFAGSGTTGVAALAEGMRFVGIERDEEYAEIARARLERCLDVTEIEPVEDATREVEVPRGIQLRLL